MFAYGILKLIYAPHKAFKEMIQNPKYHGPILIMILFAAAYTGFEYVAASKVYDEQTIPTLLSGDEWTENHTLWSSNTSITITTSNDSLSGGYYGNKSIEYSLVNDKQIWAQLNFTEPINCSGLEGYKNVSFRIKPDYPNTTQPVNADFYLFFDQTDYFYYNLTEDFVSFTEPLWYNLTIAVGPESGWTESSTSADWSNINILGFRFDWSENSNITIRIDGLVFRGVFKPIIENVGSSVFNYSMGAFMQFVIKWVFLSGLLYIMIRGLGGKIVWKPLLVLVGSVLITIFIQAMVNAALFSTLPTIYRPLELFSGVEGEFNVAAIKIMNDILLVNNIYGYVQMAVFVWTITLCALATREVAEFSLTKSFLVGSVAYFISMIAAGFIGFSI
ncbi:MAG: hypothetical protein OEY22_08005 [Candidatus Bathyarchaeota archaeon]|nr:hypothetical protein [Candidatus Bathyarchaeota archaeon]